MKILTSHRFSIVLLALIFFSACAPNLPTASAPTLDPTLVARAAEATVTAIARANAPTPVPPTASPAPTEASAPTTAPVSNDFWVVYLLHHKLATMDGTGTKTALLTNTPGLDYLPTWSPNGKALAFLRFDGSNRQDGILNVLTPASATPRTLDGATKYNHFVWTPDSQQILATSGFFGAFDVALIDYYSGQSTLVSKTVAEYPRISPDGKSIAILINTGAYCDGKGCTLPNDLFLYDIASRQTTRLTGDALAKMAVAWSPDGQQISYHLANDPTSLVEIIQADGKLVASKQAPPWWTADYLPSPDGSQYAYFSNQLGDGAAEIYARPTSGGDARRVIRLEKTEDTVANIDYLRWRPDGSGLIFNMWTKLYTVNIDGGGLRTLPLSLENVFYDVRPATDTFTPPPEPTAPATWKLCPGALDSRLDIGRKAKVTTDPPTPNNVREGPGRGLRMVGQIKPGEEIEIIGGPQCDNGMIWWEIRSRVSGLKGYTLEGDKTTYWLVPEP
jgi:Tol biopolymer transport system component